MNKPVREGFVDDKQLAEVEAAQPERPADTPSDAPAQIVLIPEKWPVTVKLLRKPVRNAKNELVSELTFREPTGRDITRYGNPVHIDQTGEAKIDEQKMTLIISGLSGTLLPFIEAMDPRDWNSCAYRLRGFFLPDPAAWS
jgi:hypothetical protein